MPKRPSPAGSLLCPSCGAPVPDDAPHRPFCTERCRWVDLGRWFDEAYSVPGEAAIDMEGLAPLEEREREEPDA